MNQSGNGVGLSICRQICRCLGGDLIVYSKLGKGTKFTFTMDASFTKQNSQEDIDAILRKKPTPARSKSPARLNKSTAIVSAAADVRNLQNEEPSRLVKF